MSTNLNMHLKPSVQNVWQNLYTVVGTPCRQSSAKIEFWQSWRLARGRFSEKQPSEVRAGPPLGAKESCSKIQKWSVAQTASIQNSGAANRMPDVT